MAKTMLMITSVASMIKQFNMDNIAILQELGYQVHVATNFEHGSTMNAEENEKLKTELEQLRVVIHQVDFPRGTGSPKIIMKVLKQLTNVMKVNDFHFIHCHSTIGGICGRIIGHKFHIKVIYTAHGFQFYKGSSLKSWLIIYPIEKYLSRYTDILITINQEDFQLARLKFHAKNIEYVPGIGIDVEKISNIEIDRDRERKNLGISEHSIFILSVGELSNRKNHAMVLRALNSIKQKNIIYGICGIGDNKQYLLDLAKKSGIEEQFILFGYRTDIITIMKAADLFIFPSFLEGLPVSLMEAMAAGVPVMASAIRGNTDLIEDGVNGYLFSPKDKAEIKNKINRYIDSNKQEATCFSIRSQEKIKSFDEKIVIRYMNNIYNLI